MAREPINVEEELLAQAEEEEENQRRAFEEQQQLEQMYEMQAAEEEAHQNSPANQVKNLATDYAKSALKTAAKEQAVAAASAAGSAIVSTAPVWAPILGIIILVLGMGMFVLFTLVAKCNESSLSGSAARWFSWGASFVPATGGADICEHLAIDTNPPSSGGAGASTGFPGPTEGVTDAEARRILATAGITVNKTCADPTREIANPPGQTCLGGTKVATLTEIIALANACGGTSTANTNKCGVVVTGAAEPGHATNATCTHSTGHKIDIRNNQEVNNYILARTPQGQYINFSPAGNRGGDSLFTRNNSNGVIYAQESDHWDIGPVGCA